MCRQLEGLRSHLVQPAAGSSHPFACWSRHVTRPRNSSGRRRTSRLTGPKNARCPRAGNQPRGSRQPGHAGTAATSGRTDEAPDRCPQDHPHGRRCNCHAELHELALDPPVSPIADSPSPGGRQGGRCPGLSASVPACAACSCRTSRPPACGARPAASPASRGRPRPSACEVQAAPARRARPGQPDDPVGSRNDAKAADLLIFRH
jgi:hypothetical protein